MDLASNAKTRAKGSNLRAQYGTQPESEREQESISSYLALKIRYIRSIHCGLVLHPVGNLIADGPHGLE